MFEALWSKVRLVFERLSETETSCWYLKLHTQDRREFLDP